MTEKFGATVVADALAGYGVSHVFMVTAILRRTMVELERRYPEIVPVATHGEKAAAYMADGYARVTGRPGVCGAQKIGALNLAAGMREPFLAGSPVIAFTGGRVPSTAFRRTYQEADDFRAWDAVTKLNGFIADPDRFSDMIRHAFRVATTGTPGPVHLEIVGLEGQLDREPTTVEAVIEPQFAQIPPFRPQPADAELIHILDLIESAECPVIVAGGGVRHSRAGAELVAFAEALSIPVATSANGKDTMPGKHPLSVGVVGSYSRETANLTVNKADLVVFIGTRTGGMTTHFWAVPPIGTPAIQIDIEPEVLGRNYPLQAAVAGDAKVTLARLRELAQTRTVKSRDAWMHEIDELTQRWVAKYREVLVSDAVPIRPERLVAEMGNFLPEDAVILADTGHAGQWLAQYYDVGAAQSYLRSAGHLGWAFSAGLGAKAGVPDRPVVTFTGDKGFLYHLGEIETAVRYNLNSIVVVNNNDAGNQTKGGFDLLYGGQSSERGHKMFTFGKTDYAKIAEVFGAVGIRVDRPEQLPSAFDQALSASANSPVVMDVHTGADILAPAALTGEGLSGQTSWLAPPTTKS